MTIQEAIHVDSEILGGTPVFNGTRVAVKTLFDYLESSSLDDFLEGYPGVRREQAEAVIEGASEIMINMLRQHESVA